MKTFKFLTIVALAFIISSCANIASFPVSSVTPAADIVLKKKYDNNGNALIKITAKNLASVERIDPSKKAYIVWVLSEYDGVRNIGKLKNENVETAVLETLVPYKFSQVFITAEEMEDASYPSGIEIARIKY